MEDPYEVQLYEPSALFDLVGAEALEDDKGQVSCLECGFTFTLYGRQLRRWHQGVLTRKCVWCISGRHKRIRVTRAELDYWRCPQYEVDEEGNPTGVKIHDGFQPAELREMAEEIWGPMSRWKDRFWEYPSAHLNNQAATDDVRAVA